MNQIVEAGVTIVLAIIGLAILATILSRQANTVGVIQAGATGLATNIAVAQSPVTGTGLQLSLGYPSAGNLGFGFGS
jgi:hypothetical protein